MEKTTEVSAMQVAAFKVYPVLQDVHKVAEVLQVLQLLQAKHLPEGSPLYIFM